LQAFFYDGWKHKRIDTELAKMEKVSARRAEAGFKGGIRSAMGRMSWKTLPRGQAIANQLPSNCLIEENCQANGKQLLRFCSSRARPLTLT
jgi:uncharacterized protein YdaU (DUF1376 family)